MASSRILISSQTLSSSAASVTFSSIPATYTDLVLKLSTRLSDAGATATIDMQLNSDTSTNYSLTFLRGSGSAAASGRTTSVTVINLGQSDGNGATANTFNNGEIYIPSYTASQNKPISSFAVQENNTSAAYIENRAALWRNTAAVTSILLQPTDVGSGVNFVSGSSFYLYGIKNS
jgi:hypothetical protein